MSRRSGIAIAFALLTACLTGSPLGAADQNGLPFWAAVRAKEVNMRVGPGDAYRINWVYHRPMLPVKVLRTLENWWLVEDPDGAKGWVLSSLMTKKRGAYITGTVPAEMHERPDASSRLLWRLAPGVTGRLRECESGWCQVELDKVHTGWVRQEQIYGSAEL